MLTRHAAKLDQDESTSTSNSELTTILIDGKPYGFRTYSLQEATYLRDILANTAIYGGRELPEDGTIKVSAVIPFIQYKVSLTVCKFLSRNNFFLIYRNWRITL
jgi:hypothetical protein